MDKTETGDSLDSIGTIETVETLETPKSYDDEILGKKSEYIAPDTMTEIEKKFFFSSLKSIDESAEKHLEKGKSYRFKDLLFKSGSEITSYLVGSAGVGTLLMLSTSSAGFVPITIMTIISLTSGLTSTVNRVLGNNEKAIAHLDTAKEQNILLGNIRNFLTSPNATRSDIERFKTELTIETKAITSDELPL